MMNKIFISIIIVFILLFTSPTDIIQDKHKPIIETEIIEKLPEQIPKTTVLKTDKVIVKKPVEAKKTPQMINILISYYTNSVEDCGKTDAIAASGKNLVTASRGMTYVAAPKSIPFKTNINIVGVGVVQVEDRGGAIKYVWKDGKQYMKIDVFVKGATRKELLKMGIVKTTGYIIEK
jgi:3D (Asp-Asp-Asp) domain-containing protein